MGTFWKKKKFKISQKTIMGSFLTFVCLLLLVDFQNCAPSSGKNSGLSFGNSSSSSSGTPIGALSVSMEPSSITSMAAGQNMVFVASIKGGTAPYSTIWSVTGGTPISCNPNQTSCEAAFPNVGSAQVSVHVADT